jgi:acyl-CoA oxidase
VFAQLIISGVNKGVHAFVVPIRDFKTHEKPISIEIGDCGLKIALNGVDHGYIRFRNHRIPRHNLLNRFANVTEYVGISYS